jgi:hypothetical protein
MSKKVKEQSIELCPVQEQGKPQCKLPLDKKGVCPKHCSAKTSKGPCKRHHAKGRRRCHRHGGATPVGLASTHFKHGERVRGGRHMGRLSPDMQERYSESAADHQALSMMPEIHLLDARISILLDRAQTGESAALLARIEKAFQKFIEANEAGEEEATATALAKLGQAVGAARTDRATWEELSEKIDQRDRLVRSENKRLKESAELVQMAIVTRLLSAVAFSVLSHVTDPTAKRKVIGDLAQLSGRDIDQLTPAGGRGTDPPA